MFIKKYSITAFTLIVLALGIWSFWIELGMIRVHEETLVLPGWPKALSGMRVAAMADLHTGSPRLTLPQLQRFVDQTNALKPDLIVLLGDYVIQDVVGGHFVSPEDTGSILKSLHAPLGTVSILGNHDWWLDGERVRRALESNGIPVLENTHLSREWKGVRFYIAGLADLLTRQPNMDASLKQIPSDAAILLLTHNPDVFPNVPVRVTLTLAGHTHGGQVNLPLIGRPIVPSDYGQRFAAGHIIETGRHLYVTTGLGTSILPVRFRVVPEIVLLTLLSSDR